MRVYEFYPELRYSVFNAGHCSIRKHSSRHSYPDINLFVITSVPPRVGRLEPSRARNSTPLPVIGARAKCVHLRRCCHAVGYVTVLRRDNPEAARFSFRRRLTTAPELGACALPRLPRRYGPAAHIARVPHDLLSPEAMFIVGTIRVIETRG